MNNNQGNNRYYDWWKDNKPLLSLIPALVFWVVSMIFFVVGLSFKNPIVMFGKDLSLAIAVSLSISNTIIQIIGNEQEQEGLGLALWVGWVGSYALGIGTNVVGLLSILSIENVILEWVIAVGLGTMIEVLPERLLVQFLKTFKEKSWKSKSTNTNQSNNRNQYRRPVTPYKPSGNGNTSVDFRSNRNPQLTPETLEQLLKGQRKHAIR